MGHHHGHSHGHHHGHSHTGNKKALLGSFILIAAFMVVEVFGGLFTNSLALLSDAGHMLSDAASLGLSFFALKLGEREVSQDKTFGYKRFEIIAADDQLEAGLASHRRQCVTQLSQREDVTDEWGQLQPPVFD